MGEALIFLYKTTNLINGKFYIGVHRTYDINDGYIGCGVRSQAYAVATNRFGIKSAFIRAVVKYGYENFKREILEFFDTVEEAYAREKEIVDLPFLQRKDTYNTALGGKGSIKPSNAEIHRDVIREEYQNGATIVGLAKKYKTTSTSIKTAIIDLPKHVYKRESLIKYSNEFKEAVITDYRAGMVFAKMINKYSIDIKTIKKICAGTERPKKSKKAAELKGRGRFKGHVFVKNSTEYVVETTLPEFCEKHDLNYQTAIKMIKGSVLNHRGWTYRDTKTTLKTNRFAGVKVAKDGKIYDIPPRFSHFNAAHGVTYAAMKMLISGKIKQTKGFTVYHG